MIGGAARKGQTAIRHRWFCLFFSQMEAYKGVVCGLGRRNGEALSTSSLLMDSEVLLQLVIHLLTLEESSTLNNYRHYCHPFFTLTPIMT
jgi:hypothetical protein